jgi:hypothetical protein
MSEENTESRTPKYIVERMDNCVRLYANNVLFEGNAWDLKIKFGQIEMRDGDAHMDVNAEISIPWGQAKLGLYWLQLQVAGMEIQSGKIPIRKDVLPPEIPDLSEEDARDPDIVAMYEMSIRARKEFFSTL